MFSGIAEGAKSLLGLSGVAYILGFIVTNARFLAWGVGEADLLDARYIAAGAIFIFVACPATLFPYLRGLAALNDLHMQVRKTYFSTRLHTLFEDNRNFVVGGVGQFLVIIALLTALPLFYARTGTQRESLGLIAGFAGWYLGSYLLFRLGATLFNLRFYWRAKMVLGANGFWAAFQRGFIPHFRTSFARSVRVSTGRELTEDEIDAGMNQYVLRGLGSEGLLASALYKGVALLLISATTFGVFVYPSLPVSIGGGKAQTVTLLLSADKSPGLVQLGVPGRQIPVVRADNKDSGKDEMKAASFQLLTVPLPLMAKTSESYFILIPELPHSVVIKIPSANVEGVSYGEQAMEPARRLLNSKINPAQTSAMTADAL